MEEKIEILGKKIGMTQVFSEDGKLVPVTVVEVGPCKILQIKTTETDSYNAVQIGFKEQTEKRSTKAHLGHIKKADGTPVMHQAEFRTEKVDDYKKGDVLDITLFAEGEKVDVISKTKGRGFQGVIKRWGFSGGPKSHGSMFGRQGGSYGNCQWPGEVQRGKKMPGRMGGDRKTVQNLAIVKIIADKNIALIKGSFPGSNGSLIVIRKAKKTKTVKAA
ncbi:MAG: 50S ribosomal protein L3 [Verrucomicrobia bacterium]|nr:MAG: 50S ribosomal protein L3 [Verrucomicrobiota bacterium]